MSYLKFKIGSILIISICLISTYVFAAPGVFLTQVSPNETFVNTPTTITVTAEIGSGNLYLSSVTLYQTTSTGQPIATIGRMYDDGTHGDERQADTIFTIQFTLNQPTSTAFYGRVTAAYQGDRNRYLSSIIKLDVRQPFPPGTVNATVSTLKDLNDIFLWNTLTNNIETARQETLEYALNNPNIEGAVLNEENLSIVYRGGARGIAFLKDPRRLDPTKGPGSLSFIPPANANTPNSDRILIFAPYVTADGFNLDANHAQSRFNDSVYMGFLPHPPVINNDNFASLNVVKNWGNYGTVIIDGHGGYWTNPNTNNSEVIIMTGSLESSLGQNPDQDPDAVAGRIGFGTDGNIAVFPSFITRYVGAMKNTFIYAGTCESLHDNSMWNALSAKGAKVMFGWSKSVGVDFDADTFADLIDPMLPTNGNSVPISAKAAFDNIQNKVENPNSNPPGAEFRMRNATGWDNFYFVQGGLVNGNFEADVPFFGWVTGGDYNWRTIVGQHIHGGSKAAALGRWDTSYHGADSTAEPFGYEWMYQDFVVPNNVSTLSFWWWMETYDTAVWDWFDASIKNTSGNTLITILNQAGKPGTNYGPYWSTQTADGGSGWRKASVNISQYRGQTIRIYFDQRLDGFGDQQRVYIDDVTLE